MLFKILLQIVFVGGVFSWEHTPSAELTTILEGSTSEALVACEFSSSLRKKT